MKGLVTILVVVLVLGAYLAGYWPQHQRLTAVEADLNATRIQLADARARVAVCEIQNRLLDLIAKVEEKNYGDAQQLSTEFFNAVQAEAQRIERAEFRQALERIQGQRDSVTSALTRADETVLETLRGLQQQLRQVQAGQKRVAGIRSYIQRG